MSFISLLTFGLTLTGQTGAVDENEASSCRLQQQCSVYQVQHNLHQRVSPVRHTGDRSLWWSSVCTADRLWAPCASRSAWCGNTAGPDPGSASPSPEDPPPGGARRISARQDRKEGKTTNIRLSKWVMEFLKSRCYFSFLVFVSAHLDVKGGLRGEVSEGAGDHDSGALVTKHTSNVGHSKHTQLTITVK